MNIEKLSVSLPRSLVSFVKEYQINHRCKSQSEVIKEALKLLRLKELEASYLAANAEIDSDYEHLAGEDLDDEAW